MTERPAWPWWLKLFWTVFGGAVIALWGAALGIRLWPPEGRVHDFVQEWTSARAYWEGDPVYGDLRESIPKYLGRPYDDVIKVNAHPPPSIVLMLPFGKLGYRQAFALWNIISLSTLAITLWLLIRPQGLNYSPWVLLPWLALILTSNALAQQVNQGQFSLLLLLMLTVAWDCSRRDRWQAAGAILGLAAAIKLFPAYMGLYLLARRQYRAIVAMGLAFGGSVAISITMFGVDNWVYYLGDIVPSLSIFHDYWQNTSITAFWSKLFVGASGHVTPLVHNELVARVGVLTTCAVVTLWAG
ncbi:MAG: glycosyltransferase family 87 protein, partial [Pirellulaceae bacterium]|nr:glycosyltransferase family 87 protein [Pirellulaceae bacterium]